MGIIVLNCILFLLFSIPAVQNRAATFALNKIEPIIDTHVELMASVFVFNRVELNGLYVEDQQQDTLLYAGSITTRILPFELLKNRISVVSLSMKDFVASVSRDAPDEPFNFQFIIDSFAKEDTVVVEKDKKPWQIVADDVFLENGQLSYHIHSVPHTPGTFNVNHLDARDFNFRGTVDFRGMEDMKAEVKQLTFLESNADLHLSHLTAQFQSTGTRMMSDRLDLKLNQTELSVRGALRHGHQRGGCAVESTVDPPI